MSQSPNPVGNTLGVRSPASSTVWDLTPQDPHELLSIPGTRKGMAWYGRMWLGVLWWQGWPWWIARRGMLEQGFAGCGRARHVGTCSGLVGRGRVRCGLAWMNVAGVPESSPVAHTWCGRHLPSLQRRRQARQMARSSQI